MIFFNIFILFLVTLINIHVDCALFPRTSKWQQSVMYIHDDYLPEADPEIHFKTSDFVKLLGYPIESHVVTTEDGYMLTLYRIPTGKAEIGVATNENYPCDGAERKTPVLLQHGLLSSSDDWVINNENESLAYLLADAGFDVWINNFRGNKYSLEHVKPVPSHHEFFQFSWDEMAEYDLPAVIDYILGVTGYEDIQYIGHSMGTTAAFAMLASKPDYNAKIRHFHALAPVVWLNYVRSPVRYLAPFINEIEDVFDLIGFDEFLPSGTLTKIMSLFCESQPIRVLCENVVFFINGYDRKELNITRLPVYVAHNPAGTSSMTVAQYAQVIDSGFFQHFDYGAVKNYIKYGQRTPPKYDLRQVTTNVTLYWGQGDLLADPLDVENLHRALPNCVESRKIGNPEFSHIDFVWAIDVKVLLYDYLISKLERY